MSQALELPVRIDFLGGWTDQECWPEFGAVLNAAVGWDDKYPLRCYQPGVWASEVEGEGTGLGISSIRLAGEYLYERARIDQRVIGGTGFGCIPLHSSVAVSVHRERGTTQGGWQDAAGALYPGLKVVGGRLPELRIAVTHEKSLPSALMDHVVLFDTGLRRDSGAIGEKVRALIRSGDDKLMRVLRQSAASAGSMLLPSGIKDVALLCTGIWGLLCECVPEMDVPFLNGLRFDSSAVWGYKLCGAGGGGYGIFFCDTARRGEVCEQLRGYGLWATIPQLLPGPRWINLGKKGGGANG